MKEGRSLVDLANEVTRQNAAKRDFVANTSALQLIVEEAARVTNLDSIAEATIARQKEVASPANLRLRLNGIGDFAIRDLTYSQMLEYAGVPKPYGDRMRTACPALLKQNLETWFQLKGDRRMIRTLDESARAFLSDRFRPLDNYDLMSAIIQPLVDAGAHVASCEVTENKLYIKATTDLIKFEIKKGDVVQAGIVISNSEVGMGRISVNPYTVRLICLNGAVHESFGSRRTHVGGRSLIGGNDNEIPEEWLRDETRAADDKAIFMKMADVVRSTFDASKFEIIASKMADSTTRKIDGDLTKVVEVTSKRLVLNEAEQSAMLRHLIESADLSQWGLGNSITRLSADVPDYNRASDLERLGGSIIEMPKVEWESLLEAAA
jgi:hypothetical protein